MLLYRGNISDPGMIVLMVIPGEVLMEIVGYHLPIVAGKPPRIHWCGLDRTEQRFHKGIIIRGARPGEELGLSQICKHLFYLLGLHLGSPVIHHHR